MANLVIHPATQKLLDAYIRSPSHALCLVGEVGSGTGSAAMWLASCLVDDPQLVTVIGPEKNLISIERVRHLYEQTRSIQSTRRFIVIDDADAMSHDAQNALLKLLEEPVENVHFILTTHAVAQVLPTITSRTQMIYLQPISSAQSQTLLRQYSLDDNAIRQILFLANGLPAELTRLAGDSEYFAKRSGLVTDARSFLQSNEYERLVILKKYTDRTLALEFLGMCARLLNFNILKQHNYGVAEIMTTLDVVMQRISANGHVRTHLMLLVTKLP